MKFLFVVNPVAGDNGNGDSQEIIESYIRRFDLEARIWKSSGENDLRKLKAQIDEYSPERVAAVGGDGTVQLVAQALEDHQIPMGIIPAGSANGLARELGIPDDLEEALKIFLLTRFQRDLDVIRINDQYCCLHIADVGINARMVKDYNDDPKRGMTTYAKYFFKHFPNREPIRFDITCNQKSEEWEGFMLAIANARRFGTGVVLNPPGDPFDGKFEIVLVRDLSLKAIIEAGMSTITEVEQTGENPVISCQEAQITLPEPTVLQIDGEVIGEVEHIHSKIEKGALQVLLPVSEKEDPGKEGG